jgi:hypothetical protein
MVVVIILGWIFGVKFENSPAVDERLVNIIMVGTFILPAILIPGAEIYIYLREKKKWPYDRRGTSRSSLSAHPKVSALKGLGFEILKSSKISKEENHKVKKSKFLSLKD